MFRQRSEEEYLAGSAGGARDLFTLGPYDFQDTIGEDDSLHHFVLESADDESGVYEVDRPTMYEFMARFLAGMYEMEEYELERSPGHDALLDMLEMVTARARTGETGFSWDEFDHGDSELLDG